MRKYFLKYGFEPHIKKLKEKLEKDVTETSALTGSELKVLREELETNILGVFEKRLEEV